MPPREHAFGHGQLAYVQIPALDVGASAAFYKEIFKWEVRAGTEAHLSFTDAAGQIIGAFVTGRAISNEPGVVLYIYVHGIDATLAKMVASGSTVVREAYAEGDVWVSTFTDPAGNVIGIWQFDPR